MSHPRSTNRWRVSTVCRAALLTVAAGMVWVFVLVFVGSIVVEFFHKPQTEYQQHQFLFRKDGQRVWKTRSYRDGQNVKTAYHDLDGTPIEMVEKDESFRAVMFVDPRIWKRPRRAAWRPDVVQMNSRASEVCFFEDLGTRGQFTLFELPSKQHVGWIGQQGFSKVPLSETQQFPIQSGTERAGLIGIGDDYVRSLGWTTSNYYQRTDQRTGKLLIEPGGRRVHWIDLRDRSSRLVWNGEPVWAASFEGPDDAQTKQMRVVVRTEDSLRVISLGAASLPAASAVPLTGTLTVVETLRLPESVRRSALLQWERTSEGPLFVEPLFTNGWKLTWATPKGTVLREQVVPHRDISPGGRRARGVAVAVDSNPGVWGFPDLGHDPSGGFRILIGGLSPRTAIGFGVGSCVTRCRIEKDRIAGGGVACVGRGVVLAGGAAIATLRRFDRRATVLGRVDAGLRCAGVSGVSRASNVVASERSAVRVVSRTATVRERPRGHRRGDSSGTAAP